MHEWLIQLSHTIVKCVCQGMHISNVPNVPAAGFRSDPIFYTKPLVRSAWIASTCFYSSSNQDFLETFDEQAVPAS